MATTLGVLAMASEFWVLLIEDAKGACLPQQASLEGGFSGDSIPRRCSGYSEDSAHVFGCFSRFPGFPGFPRTNWHIFLLFSDTPHFTTWKPYIWRPKNASHCTRRPKRLQRRKRTGTRLSCPSVSRSAAKAFLGTSQSEVYPMGRVLVTQFGVPFLRVITSTNWWNVKICYYG